ncbi:MAG: UPF0280 family protein [Pseudomonadota bacterium]
MTAAPQHALLPDGRLHLHHGPIDLIIGLDAEDRTALFRAACARFDTLLHGLTAELTHLRRPLRNTTFTGPVAQRMARAVSAHAGFFVTPMAAVAGAVADEILAAMLAEHSPDKAYVNNGGDIAFHLAGNKTFNALCPAGDISLTALDPGRGIATSGWDGRSHSLGIADAVTVLAPTAAAADVAATLIANAVDLPEHPAVSRSAANVLSPDSDLGTRMVTTHVGPLCAADVKRALSCGAVVARDMIEKGNILQAVLCLQGQTQVLNLQGARVDA